MMYSRNLYCLPVDMAYGSLLSLHNLSAHACDFIPSGGRVGAARLIQHMALNRV